MSTVTPPADIGLDQIIAVVRQYWGYGELRPLQEDAIRAGIQRRDSLVVMPTGGGKSLCYQVPPVLANRTDVVVSPLISLMKDQVDGLVSCGYPAVALHSGLTDKARRDAEAMIASGQARLIFVSPERLLTSWFMQWIQRCNVSSFAIDEAHCISQWGHDFRPEYRQLRTLKDRFPRASVHAYTATATQRVREDIVAQLGLKDAQVLVGTFDRPNLIYRVIPRADGAIQIAQILRRHKDQAAIVYCISRKDTEHTAEALRSLKINAEPYHAGMTPEQRRKTQEAFADERLDVVVATVAFGMGIDRSNVRCVIHAAMPKSIEHYQQETGRAGRDGLEAECVLLYSGGDVVRWEMLIEKSAEGADDPRPVIDASMRLLNDMRRFASNMHCRHKSLSEYFGQAYPKANCGACDACLDETETIADATVVAQKILSCVARVKERFGVGHVVDVLRGMQSEKILQFRHCDLSTYGLMREFDKKHLTNLVHQLVDQGLLSRSEGEYPVLLLNAKSWEVLRGQAEVRLVDPGRGTIKRTKAEEVSWEGVDKGLFEALRGLRRSMAEERGVPPFVIFSDATLREMAALRPATKAAMLAVRGVGQKKFAELGEPFIACIVDYCRDNGLEVDEGPGGGSRDGAGAGPNGAGKAGAFSRDRASTYDGGEDEEPLTIVTGAKKTAFEMFDRGASVDDVARTLSRARSTTMGYLAEFIEFRQPERIDAWVDAAAQRKVLDAARTSEDRRLKPIFERLGGDVPYEVIRLVLAHLEVRPDAYVATK